MIATLIHFFRNAEEQLEKNLQQKTFLKTTIMNFL